MGKTYNKDYRRLKSQKGANKFLNSASITRNGRESNMNSVSEPLIGNESYLSLKIHTLRVQMKTIMIVVPICTVKVIRIEKSD